MKDIKLFVQNQISLISIDNNEEKEHLLSEILSKSDACFLWVQLVMEELLPLHIFETMMSVLQGIPEGMISYYQKTVTEMAENRREKHIVKAILLWVVCSTRSLTVFELSEALKLDINVRLPNTKVAIEGLCGQFVTVDKQTNLVHVIHLTAREFLLSDDAGEFKISKSEAHERIALTVLQLLVGPPMQPPRHRRLIDRRGPVHAISPLTDYSITQFSEHVFSASTESDKILAALNKFFTTTILSWIEKIATRKFLHHLIHVAKDLKGYLDRRAKYQSPLNRYVSNIDVWAADLSRLATKFGGALASQPRSIYFLIPPLCPTDTAIYRQFGRSSDGLTVSGFQNSYWDDCAATVSFEAETASAVACDNNLIAVGFESGEIHLYNHGSFQKERVIRHRVPVDLLLLDPLGSFVITSCIKYLTAWDLAGNHLWQKRLRSRCIVLTVSSTFIAGLTMSGRVIHWDVATGRQIEDHLYPYQSLDPNSQLQADLVKAPSKAAFGPGLELLAIAYRNAPTCIYELQGHSWIAWATDENPRQMVVDLVFNPNPEVNLLLIAYDDSRLSLYDSWSGVLLQSQKPETHALLTSLSCSADGRTFGTIDVLGNLQIWDFESLTPIYHLVTPNQSFRILSFTSDGFNLVDVVDHEMKIWAPSALVRKTIEEEAKMSEQAIVLPVNRPVIFNSSIIRCAVAHQTRPAVFIGNYNGDVLAYETTNAEKSNPMSPLYSHNGAVVKCLAVHGDVIASADVNGRVQVWQLDTSRPNMIQAGKLKRRVRVSAAICQILFDQTGNYLLVSTMDSDHVYDVEDGTLVGSLPFNENERSIWKWTILPNSKHNQQFTLIHNHELIYYLAKTFPTKCGGARVELDYKIANGLVETGIDFALLHPQSMSLILDVRQQLGYVTKNSLFVFKLPEISSETSTVALQPSKTLNSDFTHFLGISQADQRLVYLNRNNWVSSTNLTSISQTDNARHFFVPNEYMANGNNILPIKTTDDRFVFCLYDKLAVVKNGLLFKELMASG
jgi:WD40 repeat protein